MLHSDKQIFVGTRATMSKKITASDAMHGGGWNSHMKPTGMVVENFEIAS